MIDTVKIVAQIDKDTYDKISYFSNVQTKFNKSTGELFYKITSDSLEGSFDSRLSVHVGCGSKYNFVNKYYIEVEGSYHKIKLGHNAFNGTTDLIEITTTFIKMVEQFYEIDLPEVDLWFLKRVDVTRSFDLSSNEVVRKYIRCLKNLSYPRRKVDFHDSPSDCSIYASGLSTTLKIYNKLLEFQKHDKKKLLNFDDFDVFGFERTIKGFVRFECEVKSKKLSEFYGDKNVLVIDVQYSNLLKIWRDEFMKLLKFDNNAQNFYKVRTKEDVKLRLFENYNESLAGNLYQFFILILNEGYESIKEVTNKATFYRKIKQLKSVGVDFSQNDFEDIVVPNDSNLVDFDPFTWKEVI